MKVARVLFALLIALSVAVLPAAGGVAAVVKSTEMADVAAMDDMDCCPHKANPCDTAADRAACMAMCALNCFSFGGATVSTIIFPLHRARLTPAVATNPFNSRTGSPPFRPPRV
jgi:hypothetical protein